MARRIAAVPLMVMEVETRSRGIPRKMVSMTGGEVRRGAVDGPGGGVSGQGGAAEDGCHGCQGVDGDADLARHPQGERIVAVQAELGGEVEGQRQAGLPLPEEEAEALVGLDR